MCEDGRLNLSVIPKIPLRPSGDCFFRLRGFRALDGKPLADCRALSVALKRRGAAGQPRAFVRHDGEHALAMKIERF